MVSGKLLFPPDGKIWEREALGFFDLPVFEIHEGVATEDADGDLEFSTLGIDFFDNSILVLERTIGHFHLVADFKMNLRLDSVFAVAYLREQAFDFFWPHGNRAVFCSSESQDARCVFDEIPSLLDQLVAFIKQVHVDDEIAWEKLAGGLGLLAPLNFLHALGGDEHLENEVGHLIGEDAAVDVVLHLLLLSGEDMNDEPLIFWG